MPNNVSRIFIAEEMPGFAAAIAPAGVLPGDATGRDTSLVGAPQELQNFVSSFSDVPQFPQKAMASLLIVNL
jgi:hypothetical protein